MLNKLRPPSDLNISTKNVSVRFQNDYDRYDPWNGKGLLEFYIFLPVYSMTEIKITTVRDGTFTLFFKK